MSDISDWQENPNLPRAVAFFKQAGLSRLLTQLREKYIERGQVSGQVLLKESTPGERREIASFLGKAPYPNNDMKIRLLDIDNALRQSGFACTLPDLLNAFFPDQPLITRPEKRAMRARHQNDFRAGLHSIVSALPAQSRGRAWLEQGQHGLEWLFSRYKNAVSTEQERQLATIRYIATVLDQLPGNDYPQRLAIFAQSTSGNPHMLDPENAAGRLLLLALSDLSETLAVHPVQGRAQALRLYSDVGLLVDTISSYVAVCNLLDATCQDGAHDVWIRTAGERVLLLPLRQILAWRSAYPGQADIYIIENPQVFEEIIERLQGVSPRPTLICTAGWPSMAALIFIDMLLAASPDNHLHYSGDFDLKGLQIATYLLSRYPSRCHPWQMNPDAYAKALQVDGMPASAGELDQLTTLPAIFAPLIASMQEQKKWAYQEGIVQLLMCSLKM
ncbi:MAG TPA: TIGR02679 family protein [Dictyobacter sp.]|nr:TIGR02679 family protein [Dictyobacter sp.]